MTQKYVIVHFVDLPSVPEEFAASQWPLHVTLLANFTLAQPLERLERELEEYTGRLKPITIVADGEALFGPRKQVSVSLIQPQPDILAIHSQLAAITRQLGAVYDELVYMGDGYRPHATIQTAVRLADGQAVVLNNFTLVDMYPNQDIGRRKIIRNFKW